DLVLPAHREMFFHGSQRIKVSGWDEFLGPRLDLRDLVDPENAFGILRVRPTQEIPPTTAYDDRPRIDLHRPFLVMPPVMDDNSRACRTLRDQRRGDLGIRRPDPRVRTAPTHMTYGVRRPSDPLRQDPDDLP